MTLTFASSPSVAPTVEVTLSIATEPFRAKAPAETAIACVDALIVEPAWIRRLATVRAQGLADLDAADARGRRPADVADRNGHADREAAASPPIAFVETVRFVSASTLTPPPACGIFAPVSMWAFWVLLSLMTTI